MEPSEAGQPERQKRRKQRARPLPENVEALVERLEAMVEPRAARIAHARRRLWTGQLDASDVYRETARRMLGLD